MKGSGKAILICYIFLPVFLLICGDAHSQVPKVSARLDSSGILIGQQFHLYLEAQAPAAGTNIVWPQVPDTFNHLMVVTRGQIDTVRQQNLATYRQSITLTGFDSGIWKIPAFPFRVLTAAGQVSPDSVSTDSLQIYVNTVPVDTTKPFKPIKEIRQVPFNIWDYWYVLLGVLVLVLVIIAWIWYRRKHRKTEVLPPAPLVPPYETAMKELHTLEEEKLWQQGSVKEYYTRMTDILRRYIERQFRIPAMEQTSDELLDNIRPVTQLNQQKDSLKYILQTADLAKFAKLQPAQEEHEGCLRKAYELLEWTRPKPVTQEDKDGNKENKREENK